MIDITIFIFIDGNDKCHLGAQLIKVYSIHLETNLNSP